MLPDLEIAQDRAANELPQDRIIGDELRVNWQEPLQEFQQPLGFNVFPGTERHLAQQRFDQRFQRGQLISKRGIEHDIGVFLVGKMCRFSPRRTISQ